MTEESTSIPEELKRNIKRILPEALGERSDNLVSLLRSILNKQDIDIDEKDINNLTEVLKFLSGHSVATSQSVISFGTGNNIGDISIGDVASGSIIKININLAATHIESSSVTFFRDLETQHKLKLLEIHRKRLFILEEQAAAFGNYSPPYILMEIEEINDKIQRIQKGS